MSKKFWEKYLGIYLDILCSLTKFYEKKIFLLACIKRRNFGATTLLFTWHLFDFLHRPQEISFPPQNFGG
jgi:hypothetical protein